MTVIQQFRAGHLDVLVNVQMMTEGVDVPGIQTVFLTRPTTSEILMRQMIGRALRGPAVGGSEHAYLVSFEDHWDRFRDWDSPFDLVPDIEAVADREAAEVGVVLADVDRFQEHLPWDIIRATATALRTTSVEHKADAFEAIPDGWLVLERDDEDESVRAPIAMYHHQRPCWDALVAHLRGLGGDALKEASVEALYDEYFGDCDTPAPSRHLVGMLVQHLVRGGATPEYHDLAGRQACDPHDVAKRIHDSNLGYHDIRDLIERAYTGLACAIYPSLREYRVAVEDALYELDHPDEVSRPVRAIPVFEPRPEDQLTPGPSHDLEALMREVLVTGGAILSLPTVEFHGPLEWSRRILKGWYGMAYYREDPPRLRINRLLDSSDISATTMRFLIWHEFLHVHLASGHTKTFREYERRWPGCVDAERELDGLNERFGVQYW